MEVDLEVGLAVEPLVVDIVVVQLEVVPLEVDLEVGLAVEPLVVGL